MGFDTGVSTCRSVVVLVVLHLRALGHVQTTGHGMHHAGNLGKTRRLHAPARSCVRAVLPVLPVEPSWLPDLHRQHACCTWSLHSRPVRAGASRPPSRLVGFRDVQTAGCDWQIIEISAFALLDGPRVGLPCKKSEQKRIYDGNLVDPTLWHGVMTRCAASERLSDVCNHVGDCLLHLSVLVYPYSIHTAECTQIHLYKGIIRLSMLPCRPGV